MQQQDNASQVNKTEVIFCDMLMADEHSTVVLQPGFQALDLPASLVPSELAAILRGRFHSVPLMWSDQFDPFDSQLLN